ncbi:unnamed protein product [Fraxinus pennsylvanica]|uniref:Uncharacterized protein n=1 Tax=Fraxinus pennsylvanica TaxID=56036 RepID=A0AAD1Z9L5_9LAMI|nr:unnamed protein product [Fraxinus pennsylvanica]
MATDVVVVVQHAAMNGGCCKKGPGYALPLEAMADLRESLIYVTYVYTGNFISKKRNHEPMKIEEAAALPLLMLSQDNRSWHTGPTTGAVIELIEDILNPPSTFVTTTSERTGALASAGDDKKSMEPFYPIVITSPLD